MTAITELNPGPTSANRIEDAALRLNLYNLGLLALSTRDEQQIASLLGPSVLQAAAEVPSNSTAESLVLT